MKGYIAFGDLYRDGHGQCEKVLVEVPHPSSISDAESRIKEKYGQDFFKDFARDYNKPFLSENIWQALIETEYPAESFYVREYSNDWKEIDSLAAAISLDPNPSITIEFCIDAYIWLVNAFGANITVCDEDIPIFNSINVGYGCFKY